MFIHSTTNCRAERSGLKLWFKAEIIGRSEAETLTFIISSMDVSTF